MAISTTGASQMRLKNVLPVCRICSAEGVTHDGISGATPIACASGDCARYWFQSSPWNGLESAMPVM